MPSLVTLQPCGSPIPHPVLVANFAPAATMTDVNDADLKQALKKRRSYIRANLETLTMKACRKLLEEDLGLPEKSLTSRKDFIQKFVDKVVAEQQESKEQQDEQGSSPKKRKSSADHDSKKQKRKKPEPATAASTARTSKVIEQAKRICKLATIKIPPSTYAKTKSPAEVEAEMESLLEKHGLSLDATSQYIEKIKRKLEKERELEGLDVSNIVVGDRRAKRATAPINYAAIEAPNSSDDDSSEEEEQGEDNGESDNENAGTDDGSQGDASDPDTSDHAENSSDNSEHGAESAADSQDPVSSPKPGHKSGRSRNTAIHESDDE